MNNKVGLKIDRTQIVAMHRISSSVITIQQQLSEVTSFLANANNSFNVLPLQGNNSLQNMQHEWDQCLA
jgi:hypothetical protein